MATINEVELPSPKIKARKYDPERERAGLEMGLHPVIARVLAGRPAPPDFSFEQIISPKLTHLLAPKLMQDMTIASERLVKAILAGECIGIETDHDCDGQTSHAVLFYNLVNRFGHPAERLRSYIGHRLTEGYGLSEPVANRILSDDPRPSLIITADNGSADEPRIARLKAAGIDVIVTDHHEIPKEGCPQSAFACLNPSREDCGYNDPYIAGCMVAWLLMATTRQLLIEKNHLPKDAPSLSDSLDFVAVGTIADCVSIARSQNNRAVVAYGLRLIEAGSRPCWRAIKIGLNGPIRSEDLGFRIGPLLNSDGRLACAFGSVSFLLAETDEEAMDWVRALQTQNEQRKSIQRAIVRDGLKIASQQVEEGRYSLCVYLADGHMGVQGIAASRLKEAYGRPTVIFAPKGVDLITGSVRGIDDFHVREALQEVANQHPTLLIAFGGHKGAGGLTLKLKDFDKFSQAFERAVQLQLKVNHNQGNTLGPVVWTDGMIATDDLNLDFLDELIKLEPFGREFETPIFEIEGRLVELRPVGDGTHAKVVLESAGNRYNGIWFGMRQSSESMLPVARGASVKVACSLRDNYFRGKRSFDIQIIHMNVID